MTDQTFSGLLWQFLGAGVELVVRIAVMVILARLLKPAEFGVASAASVVLSVTQIFAQLGVGQAIVQLPHLSSRHIRTGFAFSTWSGLVAATVIFLGAPVIAAGFRMPPLKPVVSVLSVCFLLTGPSIVSIALMQRRRKYRVIAGVDASSFVCGYAAVGITLAIMGFGIWSLILAQLAQTLVRSSLFLLLEQHEKGLLLEPQLARELLNTGTGYSVGQIGNFLALNGDNFAVGRWMGSGALGLYSRAYQFLSIPSNLFGTVVDKVLFPAMAHVQHDASRLARAYSRSLAAVAFITLPASVTMVAMAPELVAVVLGGRWRGMVVPFQVLAATLMFRTSYKMSDSLARATGAVYRRAWRQWVYAGAVLTGAILGSRWGLAGVSGGVAAAIVLNFTLMMQLALRITKLSWRHVVVLHVRFAAGALPIWAAVALATGFGRNEALRPVVILMLGLLAAGVMTGIMLLFAKPLYGAEGVWMVRLGRERFGRLLNRGSRAGQPKVGAAQAP